MGTTIRSILAAASAALLLAGTPSVAFADPGGHGGRGGGGVHSGGGHGGGTAWRGGGGRGHGHAGNGGGRDGFNVRNGFNERNAEGRRVRRGEPGYNGGSDRFARDRGSFGRDGFDRGRFYRGDRGSDGRDGGYADRYGDRDPGFRGGRGNRGGYGYASGGPSFSGPSFSGPSFGGGFPDALSIYRGRYGGTSWAVPNPAGPPPVSPYAQVPTAGGPIYGN